MIILIDAYNLLHAFPFYKQTLSDSQRMQFIKRLGKYGRIKKHIMVLIFDGGINQWPSSEKIHAVDVIYSGARASADDCIKEYLNTHTSQDILLVSSDRELNDYAKRLGIVSIDSRPFYHLLQAAVQQNNKMHKNMSDFVKMAHADSDSDTQNNTYDIDALMMEASKTVPLKLDDVVDDRREKNKQVSKQERMLLKKLYKL